MIEDEEAIHILLVVFAVFNFLAEVIGHSCGGTPAEEVFVEVIADDLVGSEEAIFDALLERVGVNGVAEVGDVRNVFRFLGGGSETELIGSLKVVEDFPP